MLIKLLVVDDESTTRNGLIKHINWKELGVDIVKEAKDGIDALEIAYDMEPDIIISDIRMPGLNGIEFITRLRGKFQSCKVIFLSGYSDKEYLKAAIKLGAVNYVEKPINLTEIKEAIQKAVELCKEENFNIALSAENIPLIKQRIVQNLIHNNADMKECYSALSLIKSNLHTKNWFSVAIVKLIKKKEDSNGDNIINNEQFIHIVDKCMENTEHVSALKDDTTLAIILSENNATKNQIESLEGLLEKYIKDKGLSDIKLFCAVGKKVLKMEQIPESYVSAKDIVRKLFFYGYGRVIYSKAEVKEIYEVKENIFGEFLKCIAEGKEKEASFFIERLCLDINKYDGTPVNDIKNIFFKMVFQLLTEADKRGVYFTDEEKNEEKYLWNLISKFNTLEEIREYTVDKISQVFRKFGDLKNSCRAVFEVKKLISKDFGDEKLSVKSLAEAVFLTPTYLSALFKKEAGQNISEYIVEVRMEKSKEYLKNNKLKLFQVAKLVGYNDANYYAKAFKKAEGVTPSEYREKYTS